MVKLFGVTGAVLAGLAVAAGAFGAHTLRGTVSPRALEIFETGVRYQMYHALGLLLIACLLRQTPTSLALIWAGAALILGMLLFSGSLYILTLTGLRAMGMVTPLGGLVLMGGWGCVAVALWQMSPSLDQP